MQDAHDLAVIIAAHLPIIALESNDEKSAQDLLLRVAREADKKLYRWSLTDGLQAATFALQLEQESLYCDPQEMLTHIKHRGQAGIYMLCDLHPWLTDQPKVVRLLKDIAIRNENGAITLVLVSHAIRLPPELSRFSARFRLSLPNENEVLALVKDEARKWAARNGGQKVRADSNTLIRMAAALKGLSHDEVRRLARTAIYDDGAITERDIPNLNQAKFRLMDMESVLSYSFESEDFTGLGGMENLKAWLALRRKAFDEPVSNKGLDAPKGLLLLGVQGGGKSLAAKAVAGMWNLPMLRLDMGALYNKYHGETERNLRDALQLADQMAPCVLWVDEIEKGLSSGDGDGGLSQRVLASLLTWMQERKSRVFMVATANDIARLPPELLRKGRFDEIFFVDLPDRNTRKAIFSIHLARRELDPQRFDLDELAIASEGFSGAEIEQVVVSALYSASVGAEPVDDERILAELAATAPLSAVMAEKLDALRAWAAERGVRSA
ncbi:MAG: AAA family ATPase [Porticoccaceae bacterium]|nr:AAA family ATPase [Porticoccaceae bacterium]